MNEPNDHYNLQPKDAAAYSGVAESLKHSWLACKVYLDLGFLPIPKNAERNKTGWRIVRTLTNHPALSGFAPVSGEELRTTET